MQFGSQTGKAPIPDLISWAAFPTDIIVIRATIAAALINFNGSTADPTVLLITPQGVNPASQANQIYVQDRNDFKTTGFAPGTSNDVFAAVFNPANPYYVPKGWIFSLWHGIAAANNNTYVGISATMWYNNAT